MWFAHLEDISQERIERAAILMIDRHPTFAPTLGEFKALLRELNTPRPEHRDIPHLKINYDGGKKIANDALDALAKLTGAKTRPR